MNDIDHTNTFCDFAQYVVDTYNSFFWGKKKRDSQVLGMDNKLPC